MSAILLFYRGMQQSTRPMELEPLRLFLQVAATGSFSRAATLASSTQSAVSKRIGALQVPDPLLSAMRDARCVRIDTPLALRVARATRPTATSSSWRAPTPPAPKAFRKRSIA